MRGGARTVVLSAVLLAAGASSAETTDHVVQAGDSLWSIAGRQDVYADPYLWPVIYQFNRDQIQSPELIYPNQRLQIPIEIEPAARRTAREKAGAPQP